MADIIGELDLFKKPVPVKKQGVVIVIPQEQQGVGIGVTITDRRRDGFDRRAALDKINKVIESTIFLNRLILC